MAEEIRVRPATPEAARAEIERTRERMSETIDEIEGVLTKKRDHLKEQLDIAARIRKNPLHAVGIVFGVGLLLGFLTGGSEDEEDEEDEAARLDAEERAALWEARARRLLSIARAQEEDIEELEIDRAEYGALAAAVSERAADHDRYDETYDDEYEHPPSRIAEVGEAVIGRVGDYLSDAAHGVMAEF
ncbi:MAG: DUF3618 domain-containing protein, partial [Gemmatimonadota bacterium]